MPRPIHIRSSVSESNHDSCLIFLPRCLSATQVNSYDGFDGYSQTILQSVTVNYINRIFKESLILLLNNEITLPLQPYRKVAKSEIVKQYSLLNTLYLLRTLPSIGVSGSLSNFKSRL